MPSDADRVTVSTYVPAHQHEIWREDAQRLGMSQSEFVRSMVQAGRRGFDLGADSTSAPETDVPGSNPRGDGMKTALLELLHREGPLGWAELVEELTGDLEDDVESALLALQEEDMIEHSPRRGTYSAREVVDGE